MKTANLTPPGDPPVLQKTVHVQVGGTGLDAEYDDPDRTHAERGEDQHQAGTERAV